MTSTPRKNLCRSSVETHRVAVEAFSSSRKLAILDGEPGCGKSPLTIDLAARLSRGGPFQPPTALPPTPTLLLGAEETHRTPVRPRAVAAGADLSRVIVAGVGGKRATPATARVRQLLGPDDQHAIDLVVIDPITGLPAEFFDDNRPTDSGRGWPRWWTWPKRPAARCYWCVT